MTNETTVALHFVDVRHELEDIAQANAELIFDYETPDGEKGARQQIFRLKTINGSIDRIHKEVKADVLAQGRMIDAVKRELKSTVADMIAVHKKPLDDIAQRETDRVEAIETAIREIAKIPEQIGMTTTLPDVLKSLDRLLAINVTPEVFQERYDEARELYDGILNDVETFAIEAKDRESRDRELAELRRKQDEQDRIVREKQIATDAASKAKAEAETVAKREIENAKAKAEAEKQQAVDDERKRSADAAAAAIEQAAEKRRIKTQREQQEQQKEMTTEKRRLLGYFAGFMLQLIVDHHDCTTGDCSHGTKDECNDAVVNLFMTQNPNVKV